jgi:hypothetical protein
MLKDASKALTPLIAIIALALIEFQALRQNLDGVVLTSVVGAICGLAGYSLPGIVEIVKKARKPPASGGTPT